VKRNLKVTISALAVMLVMALTVTVVSFSLADNENKGELVDEAAFVAAAVDTNTNIDNIIENSYMTGEGADPIYRIVEIGSGNPSSLKALVENGGFENFVINGNTTLDSITITDAEGLESEIPAIMNAECITYEFFKASDVEDSNETALAAISKADFIYVSNDSSSPYSTSNDMGEELYNILHTYAVGDYKPFIIDDIGDSDSSGNGGEGGNVGNTYSMSGLVTNVFDKTGKRYYTFKWNTATHTAEEFLTHVNGSPYLGINGDKKADRWTKVTAKANITDGVLAEDAVKYDMAEVLVISNGTQSMAPAIFADFDAPLTDVVDLTGADMTGEIYDIKTGDKLLYRNGYNARYDRPEYVRVTEVLISDLADVSLDSYDLVIIEPDCNVEITDAVYKKFAAAMYGSVNMIYPASLSTGTSTDPGTSGPVGGFEQQETNYSELFYMVATTDRQARFENIMITNKTEFDVIATSNSSATCKVIADLINSSAFRGNGGPKGSANKFTVLEVQPCYPIDNDLANEKGDYYTVPADVVNGQTKEELTEGTEYYAWELSKAKIAEAMKISADQVTIVHMSSEQLASTKDDILGNYDLVYIGGNFSALKEAKDYSSYGTTRASNTVGGVIGNINDLKKLPIYHMYSHTGEMVITDLTALKNQGQSAINYDGGIPSAYVNINGEMKPSFSLLNGNDITYAKLEQLVDYVDAGMPVVFSTKASVAYEDAKNSGYLQNSIDPDCNMYKFMDYCAELGAKDNVQWHFDETALIDVDNNGGDYGNTLTGFVKVFSETESGKLQTLYTKSGKRPKITLTQTPYIYNMYDDNSIIKDGKLNFKYKVSGSTNYTVSLYVDDDSNSVFSNNEVVAQGGKDSLEFQASDSYYGPVYWKLVVTDKSGQEASTTGISYIASSNKSKQKVRILQIMPGTFNGAGLRNPDSGETAQSNNSLYFCTICQQAYERLEYNPSPNADRDTYISYYDGQYVDHVGGKSNFNNTYLGLHEHEFGIVKYDSGYTCPGYDGIGGDDWDTNLADEVRDKYGFDLEIMMRSEFVATSDEIAAAYDFSEMSDADKASATATNPYADGTEEHKEYEEADVDGKLAMVYEDIYEQRMSEALKDYTSLNSLIVYTEEEFDEAFVDYQYINELKLELNTLSDDEKLTAGFEKSTLDAEIELRKALMNMRDYYGAGTAVGEEIQRLLVTRHYWDLYNLAVNSVNGYFTYPANAFVTDDGENVNELYQSYIVLKDAQILANNEYKKYSRYLSGDEWMIDSYDMVVIGASEDFNGDDIIQTKEVDTVVTSNIEVTLSTDQIAGNAKLTVSPNSRAVTANLKRDQYYGFAVQDSTVTASGEGKGEIVISGKFYSYDGSYVTGGKVTASYTANGTTMSASAISDTNGDYSITLTNYTTATEVVYDEDGRPAAALNALANLEDYIIEGGSVLMFHDTVTRLENKGSVHLTNMIRKYAAMDRYNMEIDKSKTDNLSASYYVPYISPDPNKYFMTDLSIAGSPYVGSDKYTKWLEETNATLNSWHSMPQLYLTDTAYTDAGAVPQSNGGVHDGQMPYRFAEQNWAICAFWMHSDNVFEGVKKSGKHGTDKASQTNEGIVTLYPFTLSDQLNISPTHAQAYALDIENDDVTVWYSMGGGTGVKEGSSIFAASPNDGMDSYFIYTYKNFNYCGAGHANVTGILKDNNDERRLYINIICNSVKKSIAQPDIFVYDYNTTENKKIKKNADSYVTKVDTTDEYPEFSFLVRLDEDATISKVRIYYDLDYLTTGLDKYEPNQYHKLIADWTDSNVTEGILKNVFKYDSTLKMLLDENGAQIPETYTAEDGTVYNTYATMLKLQPSYFDPYNGQYTYIVIEVTDSEGNISYKRIKIQLKDKLFNLT